MDTRFFYVCIYISLFGVPFSDIIIKNTVTDIIIEAIRHVPTVSDANIPSLLQKAVAYIRTHFRKDIPLSELAKKFGYPKLSRYALFKAYGSFIFRLSKHRKASSRV